MPILTTVRIGLPVYPFHSPLRTRSAKAAIRSRTAWTPGTTSTPSTNTRDASGRAQGGVKYRALLGDVDLLAREHGLVRWPTGRGPRPAPGGAGWSPRSPAAWSSRGGDQPPLRRAARRARRRARRARAGAGGRGFLRATSGPAKPDRWQGAARGRWAWQRFTAGTRRLPRAGWRSSSAYPPHSATYLAVTASIDWMCFPSHGGREPR